MRAHDEFGFICIFSKKGNTEALCKKCACLFSVLYREYQYTFFHNSATYILIKEIKVGRHHTCILKTNLQDIEKHLILNWHTKTVDQYYQSSLQFLVYLS